MVGRLEFCDGVEHQFCVLIKIYDHSGWKYYSILTHNPTSLFQLQISWRLTLDLSGVNKTGSPRRINHKKMYLQHSVAPSQVHGPPAWP